MFLRRLVLLLGFATVTSAVEYTDTGIAIVGTTETLNVAVAAGTSREDLISHEFASYISVHFAGFNLPAGDSVVISSPDENVTVSHTYTGQGRDQRGTFIASFVPGNSVTVTYKSNGTATAGQGYRITGYSRGYPSMQQESICGDGDQSLPAKCYAPGTNLSEGLPQAYQKSQAIARLLINGTYLCTGWLGGSEGHLFTNKHCFQQEDWALSTDIEFAAESSSCSEQCETQLGCPGTLVATTSTFITDNEDIDYSVVKLPDCVDLSSYGYLQFRESGPVLNESIYVPQHPVGHAKRIVSTVDNGDPTTILSVGEDGDCGTDQVGHDADTQGGSSGSPLIAAEDNLVVAIHHCGGCTNTAIDVRTVLTDLASKNITIKNLVASEDAGQNTPPLYAQTPCTSQSHKKSTHTGRNHTTPCRHSSNSTSTSAVATTVTPLPTTVSSTSSPVATVAASKSSSSVVTKTTASSNTTSTTSTTVKKTATSKAAALTAASLVMQRAAAPTSTPTTTAVTSSSSSSTTTSNSTLTTTSTSTSTTLKNSTSMKDCASTPLPTSTSTSSTSEVDNDLLVGRLKAALTGSWYDDAPPVSTPAATSTTPTPTPTSTPKATTRGPTPAPTWTWTHNATSSPTPAPTWTSTTPAATSRRTPAPTVASTPNPTPCSHTPGPTVKSTSIPVTSSPTPAPTVPSTPRPTTRSSTSAPTPAPTVTSAPMPKPTTVSSTPASTPKPTTPSPTPTSTATSTPRSTTRAPTATSTPKPSPTPASTLTSTSSPTPTPTIASSTPKPTPKTTTPAPTPASTSLTSSSRGSEDVTQN